MTHHLTLIPCSCHDSDAEVLVGWLDDDGGMVAHPLQDHPGVVRCVATTCVSECEVGECIPSMFDVLFNACTLHCLNVDC